MSVNLPRERFLKGVTRARIVIERLAFAGAKRIKSVRCIQFSNCGAATWIYCERTVTWSQLLSRPFCRRWSRRACSCFTGQFPVFFSRKDGKDSCPLRFTNAQGSVMSDDMMSKGAQDEEAARGSAPRLLFWPRGGASVRVVPGTWRSTSSSTLAKRNCSSAASKDSLLSRHWRFWRSFAVTTFSSSCKERKSRVAPAAASELGRPSPSATCKPNAFLHLA